LEADCIDAMLMMGGVLLHIAEHYAEADTSEQCDLDERLTEAISDAGSVTISVMVYNSMVSAVV
jgi:hypothetical protein